jgi:predicted DNA repair protein MutK
MSSGLIALLDDVAALAKLAAASLDDAGAQAAKASGKATGIVIDDAAVTPRYVVGLAADRELPIIRKIAIGSLKNKLFFLLPGALALSLLAPWAITPLLMAGGAFLCLEGYHKVMDLLKPGHHDHNDDAAPTSQTPQDLESERVGSAIRTDLILSAEIMAITLASVASSPLWLQGGVLAVVGVFMTLLVYGVVAIIVKADDVGVALAKSAQGAIGALGRGIVIGMPFFLKTLSVVGMVAMLWVGGGILIHGLHALGLHGPEVMVHHVAKLGADAVPALGGLVAWLISASIAAVLGLLIGAVVNPLVVHFIVPAFARLQSLFRSGMRRKSE